MDTATRAGGDTEIYNQYVKDWKSGGGKVIAYSCASTPVEIIEASGILPYRIKALGHSETELADGEMSLFNCSFCRACLQLAMDGTYDFIDGLIENNGCDHLRAMYENWQHNVDPGFFHYLKVPHFSSRESLDYFQGELEILRDAISERFSLDIGDDSLEEAIARREEVRKLWGELCSLREMKEPLVTGSDALSAMITGSSMRSEDYAALLSRLIEERRGGKAVKPKARLMLTGAATDELEWFEEIERLGGIIVADALCFGSRAFCQSMPREGNPLRRLAESYLNNLFCPRMYTEYANRRDFIMERAKRSGAEGMIVLYNKFCDLHGVDAVLLRRDMEKIGVPVLILEKEYSATADLGRIKTRIQAFMERIGGGV